MSAERVRARAADAELAPVEQKVGSDVGKTWPTLGVIERAIGDVRRDLEFAVLRIVEWEVLEVAAQAQPTVARRARYDAALEPLGRNGRKLRDVLIHGLAVGARDPRRDVDTANALSSAAIDAAHRRCDVDVRHRNVVEAQLEVLARKAPLEARGNLVE